MLEIFFISLVGIIIFVLFFKIILAFLPIVILVLAVLFLYRLFVVYFKDRKYKIKRYNRKSNIKF